MAGEVTVHYLESVPDGPMVSGAPDNDDLKRLGALEADAPRRFQVLCNPAHRDFSHRSGHAATGEAWATSCPKCREILTQRGVSLARPGQVAQPLLQNK